jgi:hypothetical protein
MRSRNIDAIDRDRFIANGLTGVWPERTLSLGEGKVRERAALSKDTVRT